ncbi:MAG: hypothetical protein AABZ12_12035 [Planctomycetota bacterium]
MGLDLGRTHRRRVERLDARATETRNRVYKTKERARRDARMVEKLRAGKLPYSPAVMSWLSRTLDMRAGQVTPEDVKNLLNAKP